MKTKICRYNKFGYCRYADKCHFRHHNVICVNKKCNVFDCDMRHPVVCKYFINFKRCRFTSCAYKHNTVNDVDALVEKIGKVESRLTEVQNGEEAKEIEKKLAAFEKKYEGKTEALEKRNEGKIDKIEKQLQKKLEALENSYEAKIEHLEKQLKTMASHVSEKDSLILSLKKQVEVFENKLTKHEKETKNLKSKFEKFEMAAKKEELIQCPDCDFVASSKQGLKVHVKRKHTSKIECNPDKCEVCDEKFEWNGKPWVKERKEKHILSHAYKGQHELKFKCDECEFWGPNQLTMEVHVKKIHCENIRCRLCDDYEAKDKESLDIHLSTCENFECFMCGKGFKTVGDIKEHINKEYDGKNTRITHSKPSRKFPEFFDQNSYFSKELFSKK